MKIAYSTNFNEINHPKYRGWCIHLLCLEGEGHFLFSGRPVSINRETLLVTSHTELITNLWQTDDLKVVYIAGELRWLYSLLPSNHYGIKGEITLFDNPVIPINEHEFIELHKDIERIHDRIDQTHRYFYLEMIGTQMATFIYDIYEAHRRRDLLNEPLTDRTASIVKRLTTLLESGRSRTHREVAYYAEQLNVSSKYLSDTVSRLTGKNVTALISKYTIPIICQYLDNSKFTIAQIADIMCFSSSAYFSRYCLKHLGVYPTQYRQKKANKTIKSPKH